MATVVSIHRVETKNGPAAPLAEATVLDDFGIEGDWRSRKGKSRQLTLISEEGLQEVARLLGMAAVPPGASRRQVVVRGIDLNAAVGTRLSVGPLLVQVRDFCHPCENMDKTIGKGAKLAMEMRGGVCCQVIQGGVLRPGDPVSPDQNL